MKTSYIVGIVVIVLVIIAAVVYGMQGSGSQMPSTASSTGSSSSTPVFPVSQPATPASNTEAAPMVNVSASASVGTPAPMSFTVNGNDQTADVKTITVAAGTPVTITFGADAGTTYHGGLDFRSSVINTGTITPGSTKTVTFTATKSFSFTPYWPATNIAKPYTINVVVK